MTGPENHRSCPGRRESRGSYFWLKGGKRAERHAMNGPEVPVS